MLTPGASFDSAPRHMQGCYELLRDKGVKVATIHPGNVHKTAMAEETGKRGALPWEIGRR